MQQVKMNLRWISMFLLNLGLSHAKDLLSSDQKCVATGDSVSVRCPNHTSEEAIFRLLMGRQEIGLYRHNHADNATRSANVTVPNEKGLEVHVNVTDRTVSFVLFRVTAEYVGFYTCDVTCEFPPPVRSFRDLSGVLVLVKDHQCNFTRDCDGIACDGDQMPVWIWCLGLGAVSIYGLTVTLIALVIWVRLRRADQFQSDYMNTKPMVPRGHRKKKGVQHPVPRHF